jgi:hypothetical protein
LSWRFAIILLRENYLEPNKAVFGVQEMTLNLCFEEPGIQPVNLSFRVQRETFLSFPAATNSGKDFSSRQNDTLSPLVDSGGRIAKGPRLSL